MSYICVMIHEYKNDTFTRSKITTHILTNIVSSQTISVESFIFPATHQYAKQLWYLDFFPLVKNAQSQMVIGYLQTVIDPIGRG